MIYVLDTNVLSSAFKIIKIESFPAFWYSLEKLINDNLIISTREVYRELENFFIKKDKSDNDVVTVWLLGHKNIFLTPSQEVCSVVARIFENKHYKQIIKKDNILTGKPEADPFVIAQAKIIHGTVVTNEVYKDNAAKIPNICKDFGVKCIDADEFYKFVNEFFDENLSEEYYMNQHYKK